MARTGESYVAARSQLLAQRVPAQPSRHETGRWAPALHVTNGDCTDLGGTGLAQRILVWFDVLHEGPVPLVPDNEFRRTRASFLTAANGGGGAEFALRRFSERDQTLAANRDRTYVLWFEADLYDQLQIVHILARLAELRVPAERITLICIGEYPGIARFGGSESFAPISSANCRTPRPAPR